MDLKDARFRAHPTLLPDELLSSWLVRVARKHQTRTTSFTNMHFPEYNKNIIWQRDLDLWAPDTLLERLSFKSGLDEAILYGSTLRSYQGKLNASMAGKGHTPLIRSLGNYCHIKRLGGLRFCPECLASGPEPYYRKRWRLSFYTACPDHKTFLLDRCPECSAPLTLSKIHEERDFGHCYKCGFDLRKAAAVAVLPDSWGIEAIRCLMEILERGSAYFDGRKIFSVDYFKGLRQIVKIIYLWGRSAGVLDHEAKHAKLPVYSGNPHLYETLAPAEDLYYAYSAAVNILASRQSVDSFLRENRISASEANKDGHSNIFWAENMDI
ncbi:MAG: TniQ family protein [Campylobacterales bacterium]